MRRSCARPSGDRADFRTRYLELLPQDALGGVSRLEAMRAKLQQLRGDLQDATARRTLIQQQVEKHQRCFPMSKPPVRAVRADCGGGTDIT